jgi:hypothetical protein
VRCRAPAVLSGLSRGLATLLLVPSILAACDGHLAPSGRVKVYYRMTAGPCDMRGRCAVEEVRKGAVLRITDAAEHRTFVVVDQHGVGSADLAAGRYKLVEPSCAVYGYPRTFRVRPGQETTVHYWCQLP